MSTRATALADYAAVPDVVKPPPGNPRFPLFDGLRAVAILAVIGSHVAGQAPSLAQKWWGAFALRLDIGVTIFFVISGFLLYRPFVAARFALAPRPRLRSYARRRVLRIVPAYWVALSLLAIYPGVGGFAQHPLVFYGLLQIYNYNWIVFFQGLPQAWSLCVEATFYLALPLLGAEIVRRTARPRGPSKTAEWLLIAGLAAGSVAFRFALHRAAPSSVWIQTLPGLMLWFAAGMALALASVTRADEQSPALRAMARRPLLCWLLAGVLYAVTSELGKSVIGVSANSSADALLQYVLYGLVSLLLVAPAVFAQEQDSLPRTVLGHRVMKWLGLVSYGIFLWHVSVLQKLTDLGVSGFLARYGACLLISAGIAAVSYYLLERPILRFKDPRRARAA